ncbi:50S ribosomal protein L15 [Candidatus Peregrinibacteria bacterium]|jgi:large subunit ribosomal protein L15|nr:50S ribosomal protein L15 [Candidatus Peregrinibacteria bacterium]MBT4631639.1 50S ribosomal protein L15 [Candidatus Peregrinibacteria bacterium]MBT5516767.1 50S ribosomal protein L15 [Candidatus Peregrinibacteria bacterium]MBT5823951.1 50S ribosomal protein L15 [Candidatus Peregrinibacteria bacterium]
MKQHTLKPAAGSTKARRRVGRGGNHGTYSGRGMNGQNARSGGGVRPGFEGGQTPLLRRIPKLKGFKNPNRVNYFALNVGKLEAVFEDGANVDAATLIEKGLLKKAIPLKLLGTGEIKKKLNITVNLASKSAVKKVEKAGGTVKILQVKKTEETKGAAKKRIKKEEEAARKGTNVETKES